MDISLSERVQSIKPSATMAVATKARELKRKGGDIISLSVGEPDFDTPPHIKEAAMKGIREGATKYTAVDGTQALKEAIQQKFERDNQLSYDLDQILISAGAKQSLYNLCQALLNPHDEVIIPAPYWVSYPDMVQLCGAKPVFINTYLDNHFKITPEQLANAITPQTRLVILNSPSNPSGMAYSQEETLALGKVLLEHPHVLIVSDDIYEHIMWSHHGFCNIAMVCPELKERTIVVNGVSKAYAMTGWRIGYAAGDAALINAMKKIQSQSTSGPCSISQKAAVAALTGDQGCVETMVAAFKERHQFVVNGLNEIRGIRCLPGHGTFYAFPDVSEAISNISGLKDDIDFAEYLLAKSGIAVVPGTAFGNPGCIRLSFAASQTMLEDALKRIHTLIHRGNRGK
ncbi:MAG: pyridoxal phosphate-dependent aminotransferase [Gammaproteobacteria bacterium]